MRIWKNEPIWAGGGRDSSGKRFRRLRDLDLFCRLGSLLRRFLVAAFGLKCGEFSEIFGVVAAQAAFLDAQIVELARVLLHGVEVDDLIANGGIVVFVQFGVAHAAYGEDGRFEIGDAVDAPLRVGEHLRELELAFGSRLQIAAEALDVRGIGVGVFAGEQDLASGESMARGVEFWRRLCLRGSRGR